jgi:hypothetical protein
MRASRSFMNCRRRASDIGGKPLVDMSTSNQRSHRIGLIGFCSDKNSSFLRGAARGTTADP